jgi:hypothetical protein
MSIPLGCKKSPVFLDRGKHAFACRGGARKRAGYSLLATFSDSTGYALSGPTNERRYRSDVWGAILAMSKGTHDSRFAVHHPLRLMAAAFAHDLCMEHFSSALSGVSTNCADRGAQKMFSYFSLYALPLYVVSEIDNVATSARQNPELLPAKIHASGRERMRLHLPNLTKREICACVGGIHATVRNQVFLSLSKDHAADLTVLSHCLGKIGLQLSVRRDFPLDLVVDRNGFPLGFLFAF